MKKYEFFHTTADVGLKVFGSNLLDLLENAAFGMFSMITDLSTIKTTVERNLRLLERKMKRYFSGF